MHELFSCSRHVEPPVMWPRPSIHDLTAIADALASATDLQTAFDTLISELSKALHTRACLLQRRERGWILVAQTRGGLRLSISGLDTALNNLSPDASTALVDLRGSEEGLWTSMPLKDPDGASMVLLLAGDWTVLDDVLTPLAHVLSFSLRSVRDREVRQSAERLLLSGYKMARRASHLGSLDVVCQRVVDQVARSLEADRVALALYRPEEERLAIVATHGYPASSVKDVRIEPGAWVLGHVYSTGRPVLVPDIRQMHGMSIERHHYRTFSFAAAPMFAGEETFGVLSATDKTDGSAFDQRDAVALRTLGVSAALAVMAARSETEVHRLAYAATVDALTGLFNRPYLDARLHQEVERAKRGASSLTVLMVDIDDFKTINDAHGQHRRRRPAGRRQHSSIHLARLRRLRPVRRRRVRDSDAEQRRLERRRERRADPPAGVGLSRRHRGSSSHPTADGEHRRGSHRGG